MLRDDPSGCFTIARTIYSRYVTTCHVTKEWWRRRLKMAELSEVIKPPWALEWRNFYAFLSQRRYGTYALDSFWFFCKFLSSSRDLRGSVDEILSFLWLLEAHHWSLKICINQTLEEFSHLVKDVPLAFFQVRSSILNTGWKWKRLSKLLLNEVGWNTSVCFDDYSSTKLVMPGTRCDRLTQGLSTFGYDLIV